MPYSSHPGETLSSKEFDMIAKILMVHLGDEGHTPLSAEELLAMDRETFEPLFHETHLGPIPEHLKPHRSVHGCVSEYEEKLEELERWKVQKLDLWLKEKVGKNFTAANKVYELCIETGEHTAPDEYWLKPVQSR